MTAYNVGCTQTPRGWVARANFSSGTGLVVSLGRWAGSINDARSMALDALADELARRGDRYGTRGEP